MINKIHRALKVIRIYSVAAFLFVGASNGFVGSANAQSTAATMRLSGATSVKLGEELSVEIFVDSSKSVNAVQAELTFPTNLLEYQTLTNAGSSFNADLISNIENSNISIVRAQIGGASGTLLVTTLKFKAIADGKAELQMLNSSMATDATTSANIVSVRKGLTVAVGTVTSTTPPTVAPLPPGATAPDPVDQTDTDTPADEPSADDDADTQNEDGTGTAKGNGSGTDKNNSDDTNSVTRSSGESEGISPTVWIIAFASLLLVIASIILSIHMLQKRSRQTTASYTMTYPQPGYDQANVNWQQQQYQGYGQSAPTAFPQSTPQTGYQPPTQPTQQPGESAQNGQYPW